jgi:hypothetical protein
MKYTIAILLLFSFFSCQEPCYECESIGAEACKVSIENNKALFQGKDCAGLKNIENPNTDSLIKKVERLGFQCHRK